MEESVSLTQAWVVCRRRGHRRHPAVPDGEGRDGLRHGVGQQARDHQPGRRHAPHRLPHQGLRGGGPQDQPQR